MSSPEVINARDWSAFYGRPLVDVIDDLTRECIGAANWRSLYPHQNRRFGEIRIENLGQHIEGLHEAVAPLLIELGRGTLTASGVAGEGFESLLVPAPFWRLADWQIKRRPPMISSSGKWRYAEPRLTNAESSRCPIATDPPKNKGGRPRIYGWDDFFIEVIRLANTPDGLPPRQELHRHMTSWAATEWENRPADSTIREKIERICSVLNIEN